MLKTKQLIAILLLIGTHVLRFQLGECSVKRTDWRFVKVDPTLLQNSSLNKLEVSLTSDISCSIHATKSRWAKLFCFKDNLCQLFDWLAVPHWDDSLITYPVVDCMSNVDEGCMFNRNYYPLGSQLDLTPDDCRLCQNGNRLTLTELLLPTETFSTCESPFIPTSAGCLGHFTVQMSYCSAVLYCRKEGAILASLVKVEDQDQLTSLEIELKSVWFGARLYENEYRFVKSKTLIPDTHPLWHGPTVPSANRHGCILMSSTGDSPGIRDRGCMKSHNFVCEKIIE